MSKIPYFSGLKVSGQLELKNLLKNNDPYRVLTLDVNNNVNWSDYTISTSGGTGGDLTDYYTKGQSDSKFLSLSGYSWSTLPDRPTFLSQFTNNLGNYGNWITAAEGSLIFQPIENQRLSTTYDVRFNSITSTIYSSGLAGSGFRIDGFGNAEFSNLTVRNSFNINEFKINKVTASNGAIAVTDGIKIDIVTELTNEYKCSILTDSGFIAVPFEVDDIVRCQIFNGRGVKYYLRKVTEVGSDYFNLAKVAIAGTDTPEPLDEVVRFGNVSDTDRQGLIYLTANDTNAPYIDVIDGVTSGDLSGKTKVRLGRLDGIADGSFGALSGYGLYAQNAYITGTINITGGNAATKNYADTRASEAQANAISSSATAISAASSILQNYTDSQIAIASGATLQEAYNSSADLAEAARIASEAASAIYSETVANNAADAAQVASAADASLKASQAYTDALAASNSALTAFANTLKALAYEDVVQVAKLGNTVIEGGYLKNTLLDSVYINTQVLTVANQIVVDGGGATTTQLNTAYNNAINYTDTSKKITVINGGKIFNNPFSISENPVNAALVIHTNIQFTGNYMNSLRIKGYNYLSGNNDIDLTVGFYSYASGLPSSIFHETGFISKGTYTIDRVRLAHNTTNNTVSIIIGNDSQSWSYPKINVETCTSVYNNPPDSFAYGWTGTFTSDYTGLSVITDISGTIAESTSGSQAKATTALNSAVSQATTLANNAQSASEAYTNLKSEYEREVAKAYSDGKLSDAESHLLDEMAAKLVESKNYADSTAAAAQSAAISAANTASQFYTNSQIAISEGNVLNSAANTAQAKADAAYNASVTASNAYAVSQASSYSSAAETASKAYALVQSTQAYNDAVAAAASAQASLVSSLKSLAYQDVIEISKLGSTIVVGGMIKTDLLDSDYIKSSIVNSTYIESLDIVSKSIRTATSGQRVEILAANNNMIFYNSTGDEVVRVDDTIDGGSVSSTSGGIKISNSYSDRNYFSGNGLYAAGSGLYIIAAPLGAKTNASIVGVLNRRNSYTDGMSAAVVGRDATTSGNSASYAGYFIGKMRFEGQITTIDTISGTGGLRTGVTARIPSSRVNLGNPFPTHITVVNGLIVEYGDGWIKHTKLTPFRQLKMAPSARAK